MEARVNEIFTSIQGEGPLVGYKQLFIRFCGCNLSCDYCDTEFNSGKMYTPETLYNSIKELLPDIHSVSLTGGEPLLSYRFLKDFLPMVRNKTKIYLETNSTMFSEINEVKDLIDIISADIKLPSATGRDTLKLHVEFLNNCSGVYTFAKIVFDNKITDEEIKFCAEMGEKNNIELVLQPKMIGDKMAVSSEFCNIVLARFLKLYPNVRLIPQVHKFINVR